MKKTETCVFTVPGERMVVLCLDETNKSEPGRISRHPEERFRKTRAQAPGRPVGTSETLANSPDVCYLTERGVSEGVAGFGQRLLRESEYEELSTSTYAQRVDAG